MRLRGDSCCRCANNVVQASAPKPFETAICFCRYWKNGDRLCWHNRVVKDGSAGAEQMKLHCKLSLTCCVVAIALLKLLITIASGVAASCRLNSELSWRAVRYSCMRCAEAGEFLRNPGCSEGACTGLCRMGEGAWLAAGDHVSRERKVVHHGLGYRPCVFTPSLSYPGPSLPQPSNRHRPMLM